MKSNPNTLLGQAVNWIFIVILMKTLFIHFQIQSQSTDKAGILVKFQDKIQLLVSIGPGERLHSRPMEGRGGSHVEGDDAEKVSGNKDLGHIIWCYKSD